MQLLSLHVVGVWVQDWPNWLKATLLNFYLKITASKDGTMSCNMVNGASVSTTLSRRLFLSLQWAGRRLRLALCNNYYRFWWNWIVFYGEKGSLVSPLMSSRCSGSTLWDLRSFLRHLTAPYCSLKSSPLADSARKTSGRRRFSGLGQQWAPELEPGEWATELSWAQNRIIVTEEKRLKRMWWRKPRTDKEMVTEQETGVNLRLASSRWRQLH